MNTLIFANGDEPAAGWEWTREFFSDDDFIVAVDGGLRHTDQLNLRPHVLIGDFDSLEIVHLKEQIDKRVEIISAPTDKDESDLELALKYTAQQHSGSILIFGGTGGRVDQTLSNVLLLSLPELRGRNVILIEPHQRSWMIEEETLIIGKSQDLISLIPCWGKALVQRTEGLKWPIREEWLHPGPARGISNIMVEDQAKVILSEGKILCVHTDQEWGR